jgi:hypothetical protein
MSTKNRLMAIAVVSCVAAVPGSASAAFCDAPPWSCADLSALTGAPRSYYPDPWVRGDGVSSILSYADGGRIRELTLEHGHWRSHDLLDAAGGNPPTGIEPRGYVRSDGISAVVYHTGGSEAPGEIHELTLEGNQWVYNNLFDQEHTQGAASPQGLAQIQGYVRADGVSTVIYAGRDGHIHELALEGGTDWYHYDLTKEAGAPSGVSGDMEAFVRSDGTSAIVYRSGDGEIRHLKLGKDGRWRHNLLTDDPGDPKAALFGLDVYVRSDGTNTIVYTGENKHVYEMTLDATNEWVINDLSALTGAPPATGTTLSTYNRADGTATVVYESDYRTQELALEGGRDWRHNDLSQRLGAPAGKDPKGFVRGDGISSIVQWDLGPSYHIREFALKTQ